MRQLAGLSQLLKLDARTIGALILALLVWALVTFTAVFLGVKAATPAP